MPQAADEAPCAKNKRPAETDDDDDEVIKPSTDAAMQGLLIAFTNITAPLQLPTEHKSSSQTFFNSEDSSAAIRLLRCIKRIVERKRKQFIHHRLQWLVFQYRQKPPLELELPETISSPRCVQDPHARQQWWGQVRGQPEASRKNGKRLGPKGTISPTQMSKALPPLSVPLGRGKAAAAAPVDTSTSKRASRDVTLRRSLCVATEDGDVAAAARMAAAAASATPDTDAPGIAQRLRSETRKSLLADSERMHSLVSVNDANHRQKLIEGRMLGKFGFSAAEQQKTQPMFSRSVTQMKENTLAAATVYTSNVRDKAKVQELLVEEPALPRDDDDDVHECGNKKGGFADIVLDAAGGYLSENCMLKNVSKPSDSNTAEDGSDIFELTQNMSASVKGASLVATMPSTVIAPCQKGSEQQNSKASLGSAPERKTDFAETTVRRNKRNAVVSKARKQVQGVDAKVDVESDIFSMNGLMNGNLRFGVAWTVLGAKDSPPRSSALSKAKSDPFVYDQQRKKGITISQQPETSEVRRRHSQHQAIDNETNWGEAFERDYLPCPKPSVKSSIQKVRQQRIDSKLENVLDKNRRRCTSWVFQQEEDIGTTVAADIMAKDELEQRAQRANAPPAAVIAEHRALPRCSSAPGTLRPTRPKRVHQRAFGDTGGKSKAKSAAHAYLEDVASKRQVPHIPKCLQESIARDPAVSRAGDNGPLVTALDLRYANLTNSEALPIITGLKKQNGAFDALLMPGNPQLSDSIISEMLTHTASRARAIGVNILRLDFAEASGMGDTALTLLARAMRDEFASIKYLRMNGVFVSERIWPTLHHSMQALIRLEELHFADMHIGRASQYGANCVAEILPGMKKLSKLDLSSNFFGMHGCKALAHSIEGHPGLEHLNLSYNAGGFISSVCGVPDKTPWGAISEMRFNPISLICEAIAQAPSLRVVHLSNCQLNFDEDFILEDTVSEKIGAGIEELDLSGNPCQGQMGARCLVRLAITSNSLERLNVKEFREALPTETSIAYEYSDPDAQYRIDFSYPQHRALFRTLLRRCKSAKLDPLKMFQFNNSSNGGEIVRTAARGDGLPELGTLTFEFALPSLVGENEADTKQLISKVRRNRKLQVSLYTFVRVAELFRNLIDEAGRRVLINAAASDLLMKLCHVSYLSMLDNRLKCEVIELLISTVDHLDRMDGLDLITNARGVLATPVHVGAKASLQLLLFNPHAPTAHYCLDMHNPADRSILEQLLIINTWDRASATAQKRADLSQHGGHECLRNCHLNQRPMEWESEKCSMPARGEFDLDYVSPSHPPIDSPTITDDAFQPILRLMRETSVDPQPRVAVLRTVVHRLVLSTEQIAELIGLLPESPSNDEEAAAKSRNSPRVDAFVTLYQRCVDIGQLLSSSPDGLYGLKMLVRAEVMTVRKRLGRLRSWDLTRCDVDWIVPNRLDETRARVEARSADTQVYRSVVAGLGLSDDPTSHGNANVYILNLAVFEDWMCACVLMQVAIQEPGTHWDDPSWSETAHLEERGAKWLVPNEWANNLPNVGIFKVRYFLERENYLDIDFRKRMAQKYLGW